MVDTSGVGHLEGVQEWVMQVIQGSPHFLDKWQTLAAGILALFGAWLTVRKIQDQINQSDKLEELRRVREERAAKAVLPLALSELTQYGLDCIIFLAPFVPGGGKVQGPTHALEAPKRPDGILGMLQAVARSDDESVARNVMMLLSKLQVQNARINGLVWRSLKSHPPSMSITETLDCIYDAADLYAHTAKMYSYARDIDALHQRCSASELKAALRNIGIWDGDHPRIYEWIDTRMSRSDGKGEA
jgi:hypothetical protein